MIRSSFIIQYQYASVLVSTAQTLWMGAVMYGFPMYTSKLLEFGVQQTDVLMLGVSAQAANGLSAYPLHLVYQYLSTKYSLKTADRIVSITTSILLCGPLFGLAAVLQWGDPTQTSIIIALYGIIGLGNGAAFSHMTNVVKFNFANRGELRRVGLASLSVCAGLGALAYVVLYQRTLQSVPLPVIMFSKATCGIALGVLRAWKVVRDKDLTLEGKFADPINGDSTTTASQIELSNIPDDGVATLTRFDATPVPLATVAVDDEAGAATTTTTIMEGPCTTTSTQGGIDDQGSDLSLQLNQIAIPVPPARQFMTDSIVWLTCTCSGFGVGIGASFVSSIGNLSTTIVEAAQVETVTFWVTVCFLAAQTLSRVVTAYMYAKWDNPYVMAIWQLCLVVGAALFTFHSTTTTAIITAIMIGFGFGGVWAAFPVICSESFPGGVDEYIKGLSLIFVSSAVAIIGVGQIQRTLLQVEGWSTINYNAYFSVFIFYLCASALTTLGSVYLARLLKRSSVHHPTLIPQQEEILNDEVHEASLVIV